MEISYLKEFIELASTLSFTAAAENLFISQPVLSKHIRSLEKELGAPLFERGNKVTALTKFGSEYLKYASEIVDRYEDSEKWRKNYLKKSDKTMLIGLPESLQLYEINDHLQKFSRLHPDYNIETMESLTTALISMYEHGVFNLFLTGMTSDVDRSKLSFDFLEVAQGEIKVCIRKDHPLAEMARISVKDLENERVVLPPYNTLFQQFIETAFRRELGYNKDFMYSSYSIAKTLAESGLYISLLQEEAVQSDMPESLVVRGLDPAITYARGIGYKPNGLTEAEKTYLKFVRKEIGQSEPLS